MNFTLLSGFKEPCEVCIPSTKVAESADVMKNAAIKVIAIIAMMVPNGKLSNIPNKASSGAISEIAAVPSDFYLASYNL